MRVLVACEYTGRVRDAFRARGHEAWSCDLRPSESDPRHHFRCDVFRVIGFGWDMLIAFPPCTFLCCMAMCRSKDPHRIGRELHALSFVWALMNAPVGKIAIENPVGRVNTRIRKPDQTIHPWQFGDPWYKRTCLWLKNLPPLVPTDIVEPSGHWVAGSSARRYGKSRDYGDFGTKENRDKTFPGIAAAMAEQWG